MKPENPATHLHASSPSTTRLALRAGLITSLYLFGGLLLGLLIGVGISNLPMHVPERISTILTTIPVLAVFFIVGAAWGRALAQLFWVQEPQRLIWAGALSFAPSLILAGIALSFLEVNLIERGHGPDLPVHVLFTLLFVPAVSVVAGVGGFAIGLALYGAKQALRLALRSGLGAGLAFLVVDILMDSLGWRVGAPGAVERATMITVMMAGSFAAALVGGAVIGAFSVSSKGSE